MKGGVGYTLATAAAAAVIGLLGSSLTDGLGREGVWRGVMVGAALQAAVFWLLFVWLLPHRRMLAHGLGVMVRFVALGGVALLWIPRWSVPAGPTLFALVAVFLVSTVFEPLFLKPDLLTKR